MFRKFNLLFAALFNEQKLISMLPKEENDLYPLEKHLLERHRFLKSRDSDELTRMIADKYSAKFFSRLVENQEAAIDILCDMFNKGREDDMLKDYIKIFEQSRKQFKVIIDDIVLKEVTNFFPTKEQRIDTLLIDTNGALDCYLKISTEFDKEVFKNTEKVLGDLEDIYTKNNQPTTGQNMYYKKTITKPAPMPTTKSSEPTPLVYTAKDGELSERQAQELLAIARTKKKD